MSIANREQLLKWIQSPPPRDAEPMASTIEGAEKAMKIAFYSWLCFCAILVMTAVASVWSQGFAEALKMGGIMLVTVSVIYGLPIYLIYRHAHRRVVKLVTSGMFGKAKVNKVFHHRAMAANPTCVIHFEYVANNGTAWQGSTDFASENSGIKINDSMPMLSHLDCGKKALLLTPANGLLLANVKPSNEKSWLRWLLMAAVITLLALLPILLSVS